MRWNKLFRWCKWSANSYASEQPLLYSNFQIQRLLNAPVPILIAHYLARHLLNIESSVAPSEPSIVDGSSCVCWVCKRESKFLQRFGYLWIIRRRIGIGLSMYYVQWQYNIPLFISHISYPSYSLWCIYCFSLFSLPPLHSLASFGLNAPYA